jgi:acyl-CoA hydrolase
VGLLPLAARSLGRDACVEGLPAGSFRSSVIDKRRKVWQGMSEQSVDQRELTMSVLMTPDMANFSGNVHGGVLLRLLDEVAYACASRYAGCYVVTLLVDQVLFKQPIHVGEMVTFYASINHVGRTSMEVGIKVVAENILERTVRNTTRCYFTMVAYSKGKSVVVPPLRLDTEIQKKRFQEAEIRKQMRLEAAREMEEA